jgi:hypothetical protein
LSAEIHAPKWRTSNLVMADYLEVDYLKADYLEDE